MSQEIQELLLIDGNGMGHAMLHQPELAEERCGDVLTGVMHGILTKVCQQLKRPGLLPLIVWDGYAKWRVDIHPGYKASRQDTEEKKALRAVYDEQIKIVKKLLWLLGIPQIRCFTTEADDLAGLICRQYTQRPIRLLTKDSDWWQALREGVTWEGLFTGKEVTESDLLAGAAGASVRSVREFVLCKAIAGDSKDDVDGVPNVGIKTAAKYLAKYATFGEFIRAVAAGQEKTETAKNIAARKDLIMRNRVLIDWTQAPEESLLPENISLLWAPLQEDKARAIGERFELQEPIGYVLKHRKLPDAIVHEVLDEIRQVLALKALPLEKAA